MSATGGSGGIGGFLGGDMGGLLQAILGGLGAGMSGGTQGSGSGTTNNSGWTDSQGNTNSFSQQNIANWLNSIQGLQGNQQQTQTNQYNLDPSTQALLSKLTGSFSSLSGTPNLKGYQASQTQSINRGSDLQSQAANQIMASRGLANSPVSGTTAANIDAQRFGQINQLNQGIPLLQNQIQLSNLGAAGNFFSQIPKNTTTSGVGQTSQTGTTEQNTSGTTGTTGGGTYWNGATSGSQQQTANKSASGPSTGSSIGQGIGGLVAILGSLFSDERLKKDIKPIDDPVKKLMSLRPVTWKWKKDGTDDAGVIAQDVQKTMPELVHKDPEGSGYLKVNYAGLIPVIISAVQNLAASREV